MCNASRYKVPTILMMPCLGQLWQNWYLLFAYKESVRKASHKQQNWLASNCISKGTTQQGTLHRQKQNWWTLTACIDIIRHTAKHTESIMKWIIELRNKTWSWAACGGSIAASSAVTVELAARKIRVLWKVILLYQTSTLTNIKTARPEFAWHFAHSAFYDKLLFC